MTNKESSDELAARRERLEARREQTRVQVSAARAKAQEKTDLIKRKVFPIWLVAVIFVVCSLLAFPYFFAQMGGLGLFLPWFILAVLFLVGIGLRVYVRRIAKQVAEDDRKAT